jgi:hypothetical protein
MSDTLIYADDEVDLKPLVDAYESALTDLDEYFETCKVSYDDRRNIWPGKSTDLRKHGANAFPWDGASDNEVNVCGERIDTYVALFDQALQRSHIKAFATSAATLPRAAVVSAFLKWMRSTYIPDFKRQMLLGGNYLLEKGIMCTYVGWKRELRTYLQTITLDEIAAESPEIVDVILAGDDDDTLVAMFEHSFPGIKAKRAKKALKDLRAKGEAEIPIPRVSVNCPIAHACAPDGEVIMPAYVTDPQRSPYIFWRTFLTSQELEKKVATEGWDRAWVDLAIAKLRGVDSAKMDGEKMQQGSRMAINDDSDLVMVIYAHQRLIDDEDGSEGIYRTVFHPDIDYPAKHELMSGYDDYPFVFTRLTDDQKRFYEVQPMTKALRGPQMQVKTERDSRVDRASLATMPPIMHPAGRPPSDWGPARRVPYRRLGEIAFGPVPPLDSGSMEVEMQMRQQADRAVGLDAESPHSLPRQQYYVGKFLDHVRDVLGLAWKLFQRMGPDEVFFQVSGNANPQVIQKGDPNEVYSIVVAFDSMSTDPETAETRMKQMGSILQFDRNGRIDVDKFLEFTAMSIDPVLADYVLQPAEVAAEKMTKDVTDDLNKIYSAIEVPARPNGAQVALQLIQAYAQQPDVAQRLQQDEAFAERLTKYAGQYQFQMQQAQNAEIGKLGTAPAQVGGVNTQSMNQ